MWHTYQGGQRFCFCLCITAGNICNASAAACQPIRGFHLRGIVGNVVLKATHSCFCVQIQGALGLRRSKYQKMLAHILNQYLFLCICVYLCVHTVSHTGATNNNQESIKVRPHPPEKESKKYDKKKRKRHARKIPSSLGLFIVDSSCFFVSGPGVKTKRGEEKRQNSKRGFLLS